MSKPVIPHSMVLEEENQPLPGHYSRNRFMSTEGVTSSISTINIPASRNSYLNAKDSFLTFTAQVEVEGTVLNEGTILLDPSGCAAMIKSVTVLNNNSVVQYLDNYAKIYSMLHTAQADVDSRGIEAILSGTSNINNLVNTDSYGCAMIGQVLEQYGTFVTDTATKIKTAEMTFTLPLLGLLSEGVIPLAFLTEGLVIRIQWQNDVRNFVYAYDTMDATTTGSITTPGKLEITRCSFDAAISVLDDAAQLLVEKENGYKSRPTEWSGKSYLAAVRTSTAQELSTATTAEYNIGGFTFSSLANIHYGSFTLPVGDSNPPNVPHIAHSLRYRINAIERPREYIDSLSKAVQHTACTISSVSQSVACGLMNNLYTSADFRTIETSSAANIKFTDRGVIGVALNDFASANLISGLNTQGGEVIAQLRTKTATTTKRMNTFFVATFDVVYVIEDGIMKLSF